VIPLESFPLITPEQYSCKAKLHINRLPWDFSWNRYCIFETSLLVHERAGNTLETINIGQYFFRRTPEAQQLREKMDKWDNMKLKNLCTTKERVSKLKRPLIEWKKVFATYASDIVLIT
jgi:hypothetical protein